VEAAEQIVGPEAWGMSIGAYARHRGCDRTAVRYAIDTGRIEVGPAGLIDPVAADAAWEANTEPGRAGPGRPKGSARTQETTERGERPGQGVSLTAAKARREAAQADMARMEADLMAGSLVRVDQVRGATESMARRVREALVGLPDRLGLEPGPKAAVRGVIDQVLSELSAWVRAQGGDDGKKRSD